MPSLGWRLDKLWKQLKAETPFLKRLPSEYIHDHVWFSSQPMEELEVSEHVLDIMEWIGWDRLVFATDYPHWDFDDPSRTLPAKVSPERRRAFFHDNAMKFYGQV